MANDTMVQSNLEIWKKLFPKSRADAIREQMGMTYHVLTAINCFTYFLMWAVLEGQP